MKGVENLGKVTAKKPTRNQKGFLAKHGYEPAQYLILEESDFFIKVQNKSSGKVTRIDRNLIIKK